MTFLLDTNIISQIFRKNAQVVARMVHIPAQDIAISAISAAEIHYGLARKPDALALQRTAQAFLANIRIIPFDQAAAESYGKFRADMEKSGRNLAPLDLMIAAHAVHLNAVLVSNDQAFYKIDGLRVEDWTAD